MATMKAGLAYALALLGVMIVTAPSAFADDADLKKQVDQIASRCVEIFNKQDAAKPLKEQIVGTWSYVSSTDKNADGSGSERPLLQGAVTYTTDGHFHFIATRPDLLRYASGDARKPTPEEPWRLLLEQWRTPAKRTRPSMRPSKRPPSDISWNNRNAA